MRNGNEFPKWNPQRCTIRKLKSTNKKTKYKALRNSSSSFIKRSDVRAYIFERDGHRCQACGCTIDLQVDHIVSVYRFIKEDMDPMHLNTEKNLQTLCRKCNSSKLP